MSIHKIEIHKIEIHKIEEHKIEIIVLKNFLNGSDSTDLRRHPQYKISLLMIWTWMYELCRRNLFRPFTGYQYQLFVATRILALYGALYLTPLDSTSIFVGIIFIIFFWIFVLLIILQPR